MHTMKKSISAKRNRDVLPVEKLSLINDYNKNIGGVDKNDAMVGNYNSCVRKSYKWTTKVFFHYLEEAVFN